MGIARMTIAVGVALLTSAVFSSAEQTKKPPKIVTLSGCLVQDANAPDQFTMTDAESGGTYRVSGKDFREFMGRRIRVDGGVVVKGFSVKGGLQPNPNIAAQAGAIDPSKAAVQAATSGGSANPTSNAPEFRVKTIRATGEGCP